MAWTEEQLKFLSNYLDDFQYSVFLVEKENEIEDINYFFNEGFIDYKNFYTIKKELQEAREIIENYKKINVPFKWISDKIESKKNDLNYVKNNISQTSIEKINKEYEKIKLENDYFYLNFKNETIIEAIKEIKNKIEKTIMINNKIILINYIVIFIIILIMLF